MRVEARPVLPLTALNPSFPAPMPPVDKQLIPVLILTLPIRVEARPCVRPKTPPFPTRDADANGGRGSRRGAPLCPPKDAANSHTRCGCRRAASPPGIATGDGHTPTPPTSDKMSQCRKSFPSTADPCVTTQFPRLPPSARSYEHTVGPPVSPRAISLIAPASALSTSPCSSAATAIPSLPPLRLYPKPLISRSSKPLNCSPLFRVLPLRTAPAFPTP